MTMAEQKKAERILIIDDEPGNLESLSKIVAREGLEPIPRGAAAEALKTFEEQPDISLIITDLKMSGMDGFEVLKRAKARRPEIEVIVVTAHGTIEKAVAAIKEGAYDFIAKPFDRITITKVIRKALERQQLMRENIKLREELQHFRAGREIVGSSAAIRQVMDQVYQAAASDATVLFLGESGTGKELVGRALHQASKRSRKPFVMVSCTALPGSLLEAELFGYEKGAFTGAVGRRQGRFEVADGGTIFLDEIGDLPLEVQGKLLRVLQKGAFERLGSNKTLYSEARVVAATNRNLGEEVRDQRFREDLYYRLNVIQITLPPLRDRPKDIPLLANHFVQIYNRKSNKDLVGMEEGVIQRLQEYHWPGNVRQLENAIERAVVFAKGVRLTMGDLPELSEELTTLPVAGAEGLSVPFGTSLEEIEQMVIEATLRQTGGDKVRAAEILGIAARTIYRKLNQYQ